MFPLIRGVKVVPPNNKGWLGAKVVPQVIRDAWVQVCLSVFLK